MVDSEIRARGFKNAEATLKLEGMDPSGTPLYEDIKKRIIAREISYEQGKTEIFEHYVQRAKQNQA